MNYQYCCVIDAENKYKSFVLVETESNPVGEPRTVIQHYTLLEGERLVDSNPPVMRLHANADGFISPVWDDTVSGWMEAATGEEIAAWEMENPAPALPEPTQLDLIEAQLTYTAMMTDTLLEV